MPVLNWIGKDKVINHDKELPFRVLKQNKKLSVGEKSENLLIEGDNLEALKALMPFYYNKVKCIYIDSPYNTGNEKWIYNDRVNSPQIKSWINKVVGPQGEDLTRHDKWLCMMYPRLKLLHDLLKDDGVIFISIDENEVHHLRNIMDDIFDEKNFVSQLGWQKVYSPKNQSTYFSNDCEFVLCYAKNKDSITINLSPRTEEMNARYKNLDDDPRGDWKPGDLVANEERTNGHYIVKSPKTGKEFDSPQGKHWLYSKENMNKFIADNRIWFGRDGNAFPSIKQFLSEVKQGRKASSLLLYKDYGHTDEAKKELKAIFPELERIPFETPKTSRLIKNLIRLGSNENDVILDSFAGSGGLLNDDEYKNIKQKLLAEKASVYQRFTNVDKDWEAWTDLSIKTMNFAGAAQERWLNGSILDKKAIMTVIGSNLVLKDKKLTIEPKTPFLMIEKALRSGSNSYDEANLGSKPFLQTVLGG